MSNKSAGSDNSDDSVGYKRPPRHTRFEKGQSGNPNGRPRGKLNAAAELRRALMKPITVVENGQRRSVTKLTGIVTQMVNQSLQGDPRSRQQLLNLLPLLDQAADASSPLAAAADREIMTQLRNRFNAAEDSNAKKASSSTTPSQKS